MKIDQLLSEWRDMNYRPTYAELLEVQAEQEELMAALQIALVPVIKAKVGDIPAIFREQAA